MTDYLHLPGVSGNNVSTPDSATLDITGDIDCIARLAFADLTAQTEYLAEKYASGGSTERAYRFRKQGDGSLNLAWSTDGSANDGNELSSVTLGSVGISDGELIWVRATLDVDNGASDAEAKFYYSLDDTNNPDAVTWIQLGSTQLVGNTTSIHAGAGTLLIGTNESPAVFLEADMHRIVLKDEIDGTVVFDADFTKLTAADLEAGNFTEDSAGAATVTLVGDAWTYVPVYTTHDILRETEALYMAGDGNKFFSPKWADRSGNNHHARNGSTDGADANDALGKANDGDQYVFLPGSTSNYLSSPSSPNLDPVDDLDVRVDIAAVDYTPSIDQQPIRRYTATGDNRQWIFLIRASGVLRVLLGDGSGLFRSDVDSSVSTGLVDGARSHLRFTLDADNGSGDTEIKFYTRTPTPGQSLLDNTGWVQLGSTQTLTGVQTWKVVTAELLISDVGADFEGEFYEGAVLDGISGPVMFDAALEDATQPYATFTERSVNAATVTINRSGTGLVSTVIDQDQWLHSTDDYHEVPDHPGLNFAFTDSFTVLAVVRPSIAPAGNHWIVEKRTAGHSDSVAWRMYLTAGLGTVQLIDDGTVQVSDTKPAVALRELASVGMRRDVTADEIEAFTDATGSGSPVTDTTTATLANNGSMFIGANEFAGVPFEGAIIALAIWRRALTDAEILDAHRLLTGQALSKENYIHFDGATGEFAETPDADALDITGDIDMRMRVAFDDWTPAASSTFAGKWQVAGELSYAFELSTAGLLRIFWSADGTATFNRTGFVAPGFANGEVGWIRMTLDVDNGSGDTEGRFYSADGALENPVAADFTQLGTVHTLTGTTSIHNSNSGVKCGSWSTTFGSIFGNVYRFQLRDGIDGTLVLDEDFTKVTAADLEAGNFLEDINDAVVTFNGDEWAYTRPYPHDDLLATSELLLQTGDGNKFFSPKWADRSRRNHHAQNGSAAGADANDALGKRHDGDQYLFVPAGFNTVSTPDADALDITGDIDIRVDWLFDDWTPASSFELLAKFSFGTDDSYLFVLDTAGSLTLIWTTDGDGGSPIQEFSTAAVGGDAGDRIQLRVTLDVDNEASGYDVNFYTRTDGDIGASTGWTQLGSTVTGGSTTSIFAGNLDLHVGGLSSGDSNTIGNLYRAQVYAGIDGTLEFDAVPADAVQPYATFTERANAAVVTINRASTGLVSTVIDRDQWLYTTDDHHEVADHPDLNFGIRPSDFTLIVAARRSFQPLTFSRMVAKNDGTGDAGYHIEAATSSDGVNMIIHDGTIERLDQVSPMLDQVLHTLGMRRNSTHIEAFLDSIGSGSPSTDTTTASLATSNALFIGDRPAGTRAWDGAIMAVALWRRALTDAEVLEAHALLIRQVQYLRPDSDISVGGWTPTPSSPTTLFDKIDEVLPVDADFITEA